MCMAEGVNKIDRNFATGQESVEGGGVFEEETHLFYMTNLILWGNVKITKLASLCTTTSRNMCLFCVMEDINMKETWFN